MFLGLAFPKLIIEGVAHSCRPQETTNAGARTFTIKVYSRYFFGYFKNDEGTVYLRRCLG